MQRLYSLMFLIYFGVLLIACEANDNIKKIPTREKVAADFTTPTKRLNVSEYPSFIDDLDFSGLALAVERQLERYEQRNLRGTIQLGDVIYPQTKAVDSLNRILDLSAELNLCLGQNPSRTMRQSCYEVLQRNIENEFYVFAPDLTTEDPRHGEAKPALFTGYFTPLIKASFTKSINYSNGIYKKPTNESLRKSTRREIDFKDKFANKNLALFYAPDLFELYLLHVEGGGKVEVEGPDGPESFYLSYDGTNSQSFSFISKHMREKGYIDDSSIASQRRYLKENPHKAEEIYTSCPSYVYFKITESPPLGSDLVSLTDRRSIATDRNHYKFKGLLSFIKAKRLNENSDNISFKDYSRFYLDQDTGGAILGKARADIYFGEGDYAQRAANVMKQRGDIYFLMLKPSSHKQ